MKGLNEIHNHYANTHKCGTQASFSKVVQEEENNAEQVFTRGNEIIYRKGDMINDCPKCGSDMIKSGSMRLIADKPPYSSVACSDCGFNITDTKPEEELIRQWNEVENER